MPPIVLLRNSPLVYPNHRSSFDISCLLMFFHVEFSVYIHRWNRCTTPILFLSMFFCLRNSIEIKKKNRDDISDGRIQLSRHLTHAWLWPIWCHLLSREMFFESSLTRHVYSDDDLFLCPSHLFVWTREGRKGQKVLRVINVLDAFHWKGSSRCDSDWMTGDDSNL